VYCENCGHHLSFEAERRPVSSQQIIDAGLNVFGLHLFLESVGRRFKVDPNGKNVLQFDFDHRGVASRVKIELFVLESPGVDPHAHRPIRFLQNYMPHKVGDVVKVPGKTAQAFVDGKLAEFYEPPAAEDKSPGA
jgi:hypothetical protein